jgi:hypothetical protein
LVLRELVALAKSDASMSAVRYPRRAASTATPRPVAPPPTTSSAISSDSSDAICAERSKGRFL